MNSALRVMAEQLLGHPWVPMATACAATVMAAVCATMAPRARSRSGAWGGAMCGTAAALAAAFLAVAPCGDQWTWRLRHWALPQDDQFGEEGWQLATSCGSAAVVTWLDEAADACEAGEARATRPSSLREPPLFIGYHDPLAREVSRAALRHGEAAVRADLLPALITPERNEWFSASTERQQGKTGTILEMYGPKGYGGPGQGWRTYTELPFAEVGLVIRRAEWRDAEGGWHSMLERPVVLSVKHLGWSAPVPVASTTSKAAVEVRCSGDVVISSRLTHDARMVPFGWSGRVE